MSSPVKIAPLNERLEKSLQAWMATVWFLTMPLSGLFCILFALYLVFYTAFWWPTVIYLIWIYIDRNTCETGGRRNQWIRNWECWGYLRNYFPIRLNRVPGVKIDPSKNYLFCFFPHGILPVGAFSTLCTEQGEFSTYFPELTPYFCTLKQHFYTPFFREIMLGLGNVASSAPGMRYVLGKPGGGNAVGLAIGGVAEVYYTRPGRYRLVLKNRKGFVKLALQKGSPLVPVFSFGETDLYHQVHAGDESWFKTCQEYVRKFTGVAPIILKGRGVMEYSFSIAPYRRPLDVVVGVPIPVEKNESPSQSQIDELHQKFIEELINLFETQKKNYLTDADDTHIELL